MKKLLFVVVLLTALVLHQSSIAGPHRVGIGVRYWRSVTSLGEGFDKDDVSWLISYQYAPAWLVRFEADLEWYPSVTETAFAPHVHALVGAGLYGGIGIGALYYDGSFTDPVLNLRVGIDIPLVPMLVDVDLNANYSFTDFDQLSDFEFENITVGMTARFAF